VRRKEKQGWMVLGHFRSLAELLMDRLPAKSFEDLIVWRKSHALVLEIYRLSRGFPKEEIYGLRSQLRRACVSVPGNIAEGFRKRGTSDKMRFLNIAQGSLEETRYYLILAHDLGYLDHTALTEPIAEVSRLLSAYIKGIDDNTRQEIKK
jgi:four helix bundle protein